MSTNSYSPLVSKIYKSRIILLEILKKRGFSVEDYVGFSVTEVQAMHTNRQLDMLLENEKTKQKIYVKYHLAKKLSPTHIYDYVDDLFDIEDILKSSDDLIIVTKHRINLTIQTLVSQLYTTDKKFVNVYDLHNYLFNVLNHTLVPPHIILTEAEKIKLQKRYNITDDSQLPEISRFDPVAKAIGLRPGSVCKIVRSSPTAINTNYYRLCY